MKHCFSRSRVWRGHRRLPPTAAGRSWGPTSATARGSGGTSWARCDLDDSPGRAWRQPMGAPEFVAADRALQGAGQPRCRVNSISNRLRLQRFVGLSGAVGAAVLGFVLTGCGPSASERQEAVDSFQAPAGWEELTSPLRSGEVRQGLCIGPIDCLVYLVVQWKAVEKPSAASLRTAAQAAGWERIKFDRPCDDTDFYCTLKAEYGRVSISLSRVPPSRMVWRHG